MFLSIDSAVSAIKAAIKGGLGPIALISDPEALLKAFPSQLMDLVVQLSATLILFIAIRFLFWKPITKILETRRAQIDKELEDARIAKENAVEVEENLRLELDRAKAQVKEMLDQAEKEAPPRVGGATS